MMAWLQAHGIEGIIGLIGGVVFAFNSLLSVVYNLLERFKGSAPDWMASVMSGAQKFLNVIGYNPPHPLPDSNPQSPSSN